MANQRLEQILRDDRVAYAQGSPLLLEASALHRDKTTGDSIIQLKWKNIDSRIVKAVMIDLITYDAFQQQFKPIQYQYNDIEVRQNDDFGGRTPIIIRNDKIVRFDVVLKAVSFDDNTIWRSDVDRIFEPLPDTKPQILNGELREQLARDLHAQNNYRADSYAMQTAHDLWQCGCVSWQKIGTPCLNCHISADALAAISDHSTLLHNLTEYKAEQERQRIEAEKALEIARKEAEEKAKAEQIAREKAEAERKQREAEERRQAAIRKKRRHKVFAICCVVLALAAAGVYYVKFHYIPQKQYDEAVVLMENGQYEDAYNAFVALGDYSDSGDRIQQVEANRYFDNGDYSQVDSIYATLPEQYQDHAGDLKTLYNDAVKLLEAGEYDAAIAAFTQLGSYSDSADMIPECTYQNAVALAENGEYLLAAQKYETILDYKDSREQHYQLAIRVMADGDYEAAANLFDITDSYSDSIAQASECRRQITLSNAANYESEGNYESAYKEYSLANETDKMSETAYQAALIKLSANDYEQAIEWFEKAGYDYSDTKEQVLNIGDHYYTAKQYDLAKAVYERISSYVNVDTEIEKCEAALDAKWEVGKYVKFGTYPQTVYGTDSTPIEWLVLARDGDNALLISRYGLDAQPYNEELEDTTWEKCTLRTWLNTDFYNKAFSADDKQHIKKSYVTNDRNPDYNTDSGNATTDNVFLLSLDEVYQYFANAVDRICYPTDYAEYQGGWTYYDNGMGHEKENGLCIWWLRSVMDGNTAVYIFNDSFTTSPYSYSTEYARLYVDDSRASVRPAVWVQVF